MKITAIKTFIVDGGFRPWTFVKIETNEPGLIIHQTAPGAEALDERVLVTCCYWNTVLHHNHIDTPIKRSRSVLDPSPGQDRLAR